MHIKIFKLFTGIALLSVVYISLTFDNNPIQDDNKILWSKTKLTWDDFMGIRPSDMSDIVAAEIKGSIEIVDVPMKNNIPRPVVHCYFVKDQSWTKVNTATALAHEQLHFDIYEMFARKIRKSFVVMNRKKVSDFNEYQKVYSQLIKECIVYNDLYDNQVYFNDIQQRNWIKKVTAELEKLKAYENL